MRYVIGLSACLVCLFVVSAGPGQEGDLFRRFVAQTPPRTPAEELKAFHVPPGFEVQLVASEPAITKPMNIAFDARGRLWVTESVEYPFPAPPERKGRDCVKILEDTDGDGRADKFSTFADGLNIPIGVLPITNGALVFSIPNIYRLLDTDGDDRADSREMLYGSIGFNDTHGMTNGFTWGFDGWIYACHGFSNTSTVKGADGASVTMTSGNTYRMRADGSHAERYTFGQVNPFGLSFDPLGNLYSADCHTRPLMMLLRGAYYPSFGKPHDGLGFAPDMCNHDHGSTAIAGIVYYAADHFPSEYRDTIFVGNVVTNRINHDRLERHGSTLKAVALPDFLRSDDPWFRPVDIKLGPDGALYVADFYNRIIGHYEVPLTHPGRDRERGRIWRIVYRGPEAKLQSAHQRTDWTKASVTELVNGLAHPNLVVRTTATNELVERGGAAGQAAVRAIMRPGSSPSQRSHGLWVLERRGALDDAALLAATNDAEPTVRVHAQRILAERVGWSSPYRKLALTGLTDADAFVRRAAADGLSTHPAAEHVRPLLDLLRATPADDTQLRHMVRLALRNQLVPDGTWAQLAAVTASEADASAIADVAPGVPTAEAARFLFTHLQRLPESAGNVQRYVHHVARYGSEETLAALAAFVRKQDSGDRNKSIALVTAVQRGTQERGSQLDTVLQEWAEQLARDSLRSADKDEVLAGINLGQSLKMTGLQPELRRLVGQKERAEPQRTAGMTALGTINPAEHIGFLGRLLADASEAATVREHAATTLAMLNRPAAREELLKALAAAPARLAGVIAVGLAANREGAEKLLEAVAAGKASPRLLQERPVAVRIQNTRLPGLQDQLAKLTAGLPAADKRLQDLLDKRRRAFAAATKDPDAGLKVYEKNCAICHQVGGKGAKIGPQLDGLANRGLDRILEDLLDPSRNVDQAFRTTALVLKNGQIVSGLLLREEGEVLVLADAQGKEVRVAKKEVEERTLSPLSPMPANLLDQIPEADFYHLLTYLLQLGAE